MKTMRVPREYWPLALENAAYLFNRTPHTSLQYKTPLEVGTGEAPDTSNVRVFGCKAYIQIPKSHRRGKLADTAWEGVMVGFCTSSPEWLILDPQTMTVKKAYSVTFQEDTSGFTGLRRGTANDPYTMTSLPPGESGDDTHELAPSGTDEDEHRSHGDGESHDERAGNDNANVGGESTPDTPPSLGSPSSSELSYCTPEESEWENSEDADPIQAIGLCMAMRMRDDDVPRSWKQAMEIPHWLEAMKREINELKGLNAWQLVPRPSQAKVLPGLWRFKA